VHVFGREESIERKNATRKTHRQKRGDTRGELKKTIGQISMALTKREVEKGATSKGKGT